MSTDVDDFRQVSFLEAQLQLAVPVGAVLVDVSVAGMNVERFVLLGVSERELLSCLAEFEVVASARSPGWWSVRVRGAPSGWDVLEVVTGSVWVGMN